MKENSVDEIGSDSLPRGTVNLLFWDGLFVLLTWGWLALCYWVEHNPLLFVPAVVVLFLPIPTYRYIMSRSKMTCWLMLWFHVLVIFVLCMAIALFLWPTDMNGGEYTLNIVLFFAALFLIFCWLIELCLALILLSSAVRIYRTAKRNGFVV